MNTCQKKFQECNFKKIFLSETTGLSISPDKARKGVIYALVEISEHTFTR